MNAHKKIRVAQLRNEREVMAYIRSCKRDGREQSLRGLGVSEAWSNAIARLIKKGRIYFSYKLYEYVIEK